MMAVFKYVGLLRRPTWLPACFLLLAGLLLSARPFPHFAGWSDGYLNLYAPFLFIGSIIYLAENRMAPRKGSAAAVLLILGMYWIATPILQPDWRNSNYAVYALALFLLAWSLRRHLRTGVLAILLSDLTFSVYLFHKWLWVYLERMVATTRLLPQYRPVLILLVLFAICYAFHRLVEKNGVRVGRLVLKQVKIAFRAKSRSALAEPEDHSVGINTDGIARPELAGENAVR
jgi:hypothetical protein